MAVSKNRASDTVTARVEHALNLTRGRLKLWLVFEDDAAVAEARSLIQLKKARNLLALSRSDLEHRHEKAVRQILERYAGHTPPPVETAEEPKPAPRRRAASRQPAEAVSG